MGNRFPILRIFGTLLKIFGVISLVLTVLAALASCLGAALLGETLRQFGGDSLAPASVLGVINGIFILIFGLLFSLGLYAQGELFQLYIALEENTRRTTTLLEALQQNP